MRIGYEVAGRSWMYTRPRRAAARAARRGTRSRTSGICSTALGIAAPDPATLSGRDAGRHPTRRRPCRNRLARRRASSRRLGCDRMHVSAGNPFRRWPVASFVGRRSRAGGERRRRPRHRHVGAVGARGRRARHRRGAGAARPRRPASACSRAASSRSPSCARWSIARRSTSAATADRCTLPRRAHVPIVGLYGPTLPARRRRGGRPRWPAEAVESRRARRAGRATSASACPATSGA